jgi:hypothetical protein
MKALLVGHVDIDALTRNINSSRQASKRPRSSNASLDSRIRAEGGRSPLIARVDMPLELLGSLVGRSDGSTDALSEFGADPLVRQAQAILARAALHAAIA